MHYRLNDMVFLVDGRCRSCIYDLEQKKLYSIGKEESDEIKKAINSDGYNNFDNKLINMLLDLQILTEGIQDPEKIERMKIPIPKINFVWLELTKRCNCRCIHCYNATDKAKPNDMSLADFYLAIDKLEEYGDIIELQFIGGEPLLCPDFDRMLDYVSKKFSISMYSNVILLSDEKIKYIKEKGVKKIYTTIFSYIPQEHDKVTQSLNSFERQNENIKKLKAAGFYVRVTHIKMKGINVGEKNTDLYDLSKNEDTVRLCGKGNLNLYTLDLLKEKAIQKERFSYLPSKEKILENMNFNHCFTPKIYIDTNLDVYPCAMERRIKYGNLHNADLLTMRDTNFCQSNKDAQKECKECEYRYVCTDCRADAINKDFYAKPWYCTYKPLEGRWQDFGLFVESLSNRYGIEFL